MVPDFVLLSGVLLLFVRTPQSEFEELDRKREPSAPMLRQFARGVRLPGASHAHIEFREQPRGGPERGQHRGGRARSAAAFGVPRHDAAAAGRSGSGRIARNLDLVQRRNSLWCGSVLEAVGCFARESVPISREHFGKVGNAVGEECHRPTVDLSREFALGIRLCLDPGPRRGRLG